MSSENRNEHRETEAEVQTLDKNNWKRKKEGWKKNVLISLSALLPKIFFIIK